jgi:metal-dependent HD superfamily phosphatase/phosphodiesterase
MHRETSTMPALPAQMPLLASSEALPFTVPARHNPRLQALAERINGDEELRQLWRCANVNAVERLGLGDCGEVHVRIVANAALKLLRLLRDAGTPPAVVEHHRLSADDAEAVVVLAAALHDLDLAVGTGDLPSGGMVLATLKGRELLAGLYGARERTILLAETLHAIGAQPAGVPCFTLEAGLLRLADALDLAKGRVRMPADPARGLIETVSVEEVSILKAKDPPVQVVIRLSQADGLRAVETLLNHRLRGAGLKGQVAIAARVEGLEGGRLQLLQVWDAAPGLSA